jgi:hypothetical protein
MSRKATILPDSTVIEHKTIFDFITDPNNANIGTERGQAMLENSLRESGAGRSIVVDKHGVVIGGNKTITGAANVGIENAVVVHTTGDKIVVVQRDDLDLKEDETAKRLALYDNRVTEVNLVWDTEFISSNQDMLSGLFSEREIEAILSETRDSGEIDVSEFQEASNQDINYRVVVDGLSLEQSQSLSARLSLEYERVKFEQYRS